MAVIKKTVPAIVAPVKLAQRSATVPGRAVPSARGAVSKSATVTVGESNGFVRLGVIAIPTKRAFGKKGIFRDLFDTMEVGEAIGIPVDANKKIVSKMNSIYNAARKCGVPGTHGPASVTMRIAEPGDANGLGGLIHLWFNGYFEETAAK